MAGRSVANRSETVTVPIPRGRSRSCASSGARSAQGVRGTGNGWRVAPASATGGRARRPARRSANQCCWRQASSRSGWSTRQLAQPRRWRTCDRQAHPVDYARRQQDRRLSRAGEAGIGAAGTALLALWAASVSATLVALCLLIVAAALALSAHKLALASSPESGRRVLCGRRPGRAGTAAGEGWRLRQLQTMLLMREVD